MTVSKKATAIAAGFAALLSVVTLGPIVSAQVAKADPETLVVDEATLTWIEKSNVAAFREGIIDTMELTIGTPVSKGGLIGKLHAELAELSVRKAALIAKSTGPLEKATAQKEISLHVVARNERLNSRIKGAVSDEDVQKAQAELKVAVALVHEEGEKVEINKADYDLAYRTLVEHTIVAPFDGVVIERMKHPGESVRANEAVVKLGNLNRLRAYAYIPAEYADRVKEGQVVEITKRVIGTRPNNPADQKRYRGKITFVDPEIQPIAERAVRIYAEFDNRDRELRPGDKYTMVIYLNSVAEAETVAAPGLAPAPAVQARTATPGVDR